jgi:hypothetical protein
MALKHISQIVAGVVADVATSDNGWMVTKVPKEGARFLLRHPGQPEYELRISVSPAFIGGLRFDIEPALPEPAHTAAFFLRAGECFRLLPQIEICRKSGRYVAIHAAGRDWVLRQPIQTQGAQ